MNTGKISFCVLVFVLTAGLAGFAAAGRAASRNTPYPAIGLGYAASGPATKMYFYEAAAVNLCCVPSGYAGLQTVHPAKAVIDDGVTPLEARFNVEVAQAAVRLGAGQAGEVVNRLLDRYEADIAQAPPGKRYPECFDLATGKPTEVLLSDRVLALGPEAQQQAHSARVRSIDLGGRLLMPGLWDEHVHVGHDACVTRGFEN